MEVLRIEADGKRATWLTPEFMVKLSAAALGFYGVFAVAFICYSSLVRQGGFSIVSDVSVFWAAARLALQGHAASAYLEPVLHATLASEVPTVQGRFGWFYPPAFFLLIIPLGLLGHYFPVFFAWMGSTLAVYGWQLRNWLGTRPGYLVILSFSGGWMNLLRGQNGFLTTALVILVMDSLQKRSRWTGVWVGLLAMKPQLVMMIPWVLILNRSWRDLWVAALVIFITNGLGVLVLGDGVLQEWQHSLRFATQLMEHDGFNANYWVSMPTWYVQWRYWGFTHFAALWLHGITAFLAWMALGVFWQRSNDWSWRSVMVVLASLLTSPYLLDYDLIWLIVPILVMLRTGWQNGWYRGEQFAVLALWLVPLVDTMLAGFVPIHLAPFLLWFTIILVFQRHSGRKSSLDIQHQGMTAGNPKLSERE